MITNPLLPRFAEHLRGLAPGLLADEGVVVGVSGGLDSMSLLHLLRFGITRKRGLHVVHVDHRMRADSGRDARWLEGIGRAWEVPVHVRITAEPVTTEAEGRHERYQAFEEVRRLVGATWTLTAHTADDQAETVLFRAARGSGVRGLRGIRQVRSPHLIRPLLPFWRGELEDYARSVGLQYRTDPTNDDLVWARNRLRHEVIPALEAAVPGARRALSHLALTAASFQTGVEALADHVLAGLARDGGHRSRLPGAPLTLGREALGAFPDEAMALLVRQACRSFGVAIGRGATEDLTRFLRSAESGGVFRVSARLLVRRNFDDIVFVPLEDVASADAADTSPLSSTLVIEASQLRGQGRLSIDGDLVDVTWSSEAGPSNQAGPGGAGMTCLSRKGLRWPLTVRGWRPGDRAVTSYGRKKVKKLMGEARIPVHLRTKTPVLEDGQGAILWVPGVSAPAVEIDPLEPEKLYIAIRGVAQA